MHALLIILVIRWSDEISLVTEPMDDENEQER